MNFQIDERDAELKDDLIQSGAIGAHDIHQMDNPNPIVGSTVRLPNLLAANEQYIDEDAWLFYAIRKYNILHIPKLYISVQYPDLSSISYELMEILLDDFHFPLGISNGTLLVGTPCPHIRPSVEAEAALAKIAPLKRFERYIIGFSELGAVQEIAEKQLIDA